MEMERRRAFQLKKEIRDGKRNSICKETVYQVFWYVLYLNHLIYSLLNQIRQYDR